MGCVPKLLQQLMPSLCTDAAALPVCMSAACALMVISLAKEGKIAVFEVCRCSVQLPRLPLYDKIFSCFCSSESSWRPYPVNSTFGRGAMVLASEG